MTQTELDEKVIAAYATEECRKPILDGIVNEEIFRSGIPKILWLMKEPYGEQDWNMRHELNESSEGMFRYRTFKNITYTSYGIINKTSYEEAKAASNNFEILKSIAFINISKCPVKKKTNPNSDKRLKKIFDQSVDIILDQINQINPDIIIGGNTAYLLVNYFKLNWDETAYILPTNSKACFQFENRLIINSLHPSVFNIPQSNYCNEIISVCNDWLMKQNNI